VVKVSAHKAWAGLLWGKVFGLEDFSRRVIANDKFRDQCSNCPFFLLKVRINFVVQFAAKAQSWGMV